MALRKNSLMAFLIDQDTETSGTYVPFFGRAAFTPTTPAALALRTGAPVSSAGIIVAANTMRSPLSESTMCRPVPAVVT
jgi:lauroyl/myristoyl acyltransferase